MYGNPADYCAAGVVNAVGDALVARLQKVVVGDPAWEGVKMGALVNAEQRADVQEKSEHIAGCRMRDSPRWSGGLSAAGALTHDALYCP